jgi:hypothetical protein
LTKHFQVLSSRCYWTHPYHDCFSFGFLGIDSGCVRKVSGEVTVVMKEVLLWVVLGRSVAVKQLRAFAWDTTSKKPNDERDIFCGW